MADFARNAVQLAFEYARDLLNLDQDQYNLPPGDPAVTNEARLRAIKLLKEKATLLARELDDASYRLSNENQAYGLLLSKMTGPQRDQEQGPIKIRVDKRQTPNDKFSDLSYSSCSHPFMVLDSSF